MFIGLENIVCLFDKKKQPEQEKKTQLAIFKQTRTGFHSFPLSIEILFQLPKQ